MAEVPGVLCYRPAPMSAAKKPSGGRSGGSRSTGSRSKATRKTSAKKTSKSGSGTTAKKSTVKKTTGKKKIPKKTTARASTKKTTARKKKATAPKATRRRTSKTTTRRATASRPGKLDARALAKIREQLEKERSGLLAQMAELEEESFRGTQSELTGEVGIDEDFADAGSATFDREQALSIQNNIRDLIDQVDRALYRIEEGTYGSCERCGRPSDAGRLKAIPRTLLCTDRKRREERAR